MNPYPPLPRLLEAIIAWCFRSEFPREFHISWADKQLESVLKYFSEVEIDSDFTLRMYRKLHLNEVWHDRFKPELYKRAAQLVMSFVEDLGGLFTVPKLQHLSHMDNTLKKNELVVGFINFLLQLLQLSDLDNLPRFQTIKSHVMKELRFLVTILGDSPFQATDNEQVQAILSKFEQVTNEAGSLVHSLIFVSNADVKATNESLGVLMERIELLKGKIIKFLDLLPSCVVTPLSNGGVDSLFIVDSLQHDLKDLINRDDNPIVEVKDQIRRLHQWLMLCQSLLKVPQCIEIEKLKKEPMVQVISVAYDADYLIKSFLVGDAPLLYLTIRLTHHINKLEHCATRFQAMKLDYDMGALKVKHDLSAQATLRAKKDSLVDGIIVGFEQLTKDILDQLIRGPEKLLKVFIFGMPGLGKTTLAKKVYCHPWVSRHFDKSLWCVVSQMHQRKNLLIDILICIGSALKEDTIMNMDEEQLELEIYQNLKDRRYIIVMDDIWDLQVWDDIQFLPDDENGSRILFTGRNKDVAPIGSVMHELPFLSNDQCWELIEKKVFHNHPCPPKLHKKGKKIAGNCYGLPLVVVVIAGILSTTAKEKNAWENVRQSLDCYMLSDQSNSMIQILELSYQHLPQHLKPCFLYFGVFKEDAEILVDKLTQLWIAEGFIHKEEDKRAESVAEEYLRELIDKSLVIVAKRRSDGGAKACIIHDLLWDLCIRIAQKENFLKFTNNDCSRWNQRYHRLCIHVKPLYQSSSYYLEPSGQRTRAVFCPIQESSLCVRNMKLLRVLECQTVSKRNLSGIEVLVYLKYLSIKRMPTLLHHLVNLEFLIVDDVVYISSKVLKMAKLKCIRSRSAVFDGDCDLSQTCKVDFLSTYRICNLKDLEMLKCLPGLCKLKCRYSVVWEDGPWTHLDLHFLTRLESLRVSGQSQIDHIKFPINIRKLTLLGLHLPWERMPIIGALPYLEVLKLGNVAFIGERWETREDEFTQLRILKLQDLDLVQWNVSSGKHFPKLQQLSLAGCSKLKKIPMEIGGIETLLLIEVHRRCRKSLLRSAMRIREEQLNWGNEEFKLDILKYRQ